MSVRPRSVAWPLVDSEETLRVYFKRSPTTHTRTSFYASVSRDGLAIHLKCAPKTIADRAHRKRHEHLDVHIGVVGATRLHEELTSRGARITKPLESRPWSCVDFYVEDLDGYILCFSEPTA